MRHVLIAVVVLMALTWLSALTLPSGSPLIPILVALTGIVAGVGSMVVRGRRKRSEAKTPR